jgi:hypothetical protein
MRAQPGNARSKGVSRPRRGGRPRKADVQQVEAGARVRREMHTPPIPASAHPLAVYDGRKYLSARAARHDRRRSVRRVCERYCERVGCDTSIGKPILWRLRAPLEVTSV